jgi:hypothetical protein
LQVAAARFIQMKDFASVENDYELQERAEKPEVGVADDGQLECAIGADQAPLRSKIGKDVEAEFFRWITCRNTGDE